MIKNNFISNDIEFGGRRIVGQNHAKEQVKRLFQSDRLGHAYLFSGKSGAGTTAFALAMAEIINGIDHFTDLKGISFSKKSSWFTHPDIHVFLPHPKNIGAGELRERLKLLAGDPYEIVDFSRRPVLNDPEASKNKQAFYDIEYFHKEIRSRAFLKPNEGRRTTIVITGIDTMRKESANAFLKILEEPPENLIFLLTTQNPDQLLPTIISRCQQIRLSPLSEEEVTEGLVRYDNVVEEDARYLARISDGDYSQVRFFDIKTIKKNRKELIQFLRWTYVQDAQPLLKLIQDWQNSLNIEGQISLCNNLEILLKDILLFMKTGKREYIMNVDLTDTISRFSGSLPDAKIDSMIEHLQELKVLLYQNVQFKLVFTTLSFRFFYLMRGNETVIGQHDSWKHLPAFAE